MLKDILAISGEQGLYKIVNQTKNSIIVEHLETKRKMPAYASHKISALEDIAIFTDDEEVSLKNVLLKIFDKENGGQAISHKAAKDELKKYFESILPNYDKDRVYVSDIKKIINWYNILNNAELIKKEEQKEEPVSKEESNPE